MESQISDSNPNVSEKEYNKSLDWLYSQLPMFSRIGGAAYKPGLDNTLRLDALFNHPHKKFKTVHVAGTNGKGSTSHMIASVLQSHGYKTGLYTSPHLTDFRERIRINGEMTPRAEVTAFIDRWKALSEEDVSDLHPSFFELTMMMAFDWFARSNVDIAVIEVGMGGRLDSTNVITPVMSVITNISFDHTQFLGDTLEAIAKEKAGIIKPCVPVVVGEASGSVKEVFLAKAEEENSPVLFAEDYDGISDFSLHSGMLRCDLKNGETILLPLTGEYQKKNIRTALASMEVLGELGIIRNKEAVRKGLENVVEATGLRGRWQIVREKPVVICDTGHNVAGIRESMETLKSRYPSSHIRFVIGFVNDKDISHIVDFFPEDASYYFTRASVPRAMETEELSAHFGAKDIYGKTFKDVSAAYNAALNDAKKDDVIYVGGSTFIVADFLATMQTGIA